MEIKEITDKTVWEKFIAENSPQSFFQSWNWGEVIKKTQRFKASKNQSLWRLGLFEKDKLAGIAQVNKVFARKGNFLHIRHGPIFSDWKKKYADYFLDYLKNLSKGEKAIFLRVSPLIENSEENNNLFKQYGFINAPIHAMDGEYCWVLDLTKSEEEILAGMRRTTRYLIRQAQKLGVEIIKSKNSRDLDDFFHLYTQTAKRHKFVEHRSIKEEFENLLPDDQILLFKGYYQHKLLAVALVIFYNHQAIYHHSASIEQKIPVNYLLQWEIIMEVKRRGKSVYNLWGITPEEKTRHPWRGLTIFKKGFGGEVKEYLHAQDLPFSFSYCTTYVWEWLRKVRKGY